MSWFIYAFVCALLVSAAIIIEKKVLQKVHAVDFSAGLSVLNLLFSIPFLFFIDFGSLNQSTLILVFITALLASVAFFLVAKGMRHLDISVSSPLLSLTPGVTAFLGFFLLGEHLSGVHISGIALMIFGSYLLTTEASKGMFEPFRLFRHSKYIHFLLLSLAFYSLGTVFDRAILTRFMVSLPVYIFFIHFFMALLSIPLVIFFGGGISGIMVSFRKGGMNMVWTSLVTVGYRFFQMEALLLANVGLVSAVKRMSSFFVTVIGGEIFHEKNLERKIIASFVIVIGTFLMVL